MELCVLRRKGHMVTSRNISSASKTMSQETGVIQRGSTSGSFMTTVKLRGSGRLRNRRKKPTQPSGSQRSFIIKVLHMFSINETEHRRGCDSVGRPDRIHESGGPGVRKYQSDSSIPLLMQSGHARHSRPMLLGPHCKNRSKRKGFVLVW